MVTIVVAVFYVSLLIAISAAACRILDRTN